MSYHLEICLLDLIHSKRNQYEGLFSLSLFLDLRFQISQLSCFLEDDTIHLSSLTGASGLNCGATQQGISFLNTWQGSTPEMMKDEYVSPVSLAAYNNAKSTSQRSAVLCLARQDTIDHLQVKQHCLHCTYRCRRFMSSIYFATL